MADPAIMPTANQAPGLPAGAACRACGYVLAGLAPGGVCPECGATYPPFKHALYRPPRTAADMCIRLSWPLIGAGLGLAATWAATWPPLRAVRSPGVVLSGAMIAALLVNTPVQFIALMLYHAPPGRALGNPLTHLTRPSAWAVGLVAAVPFLLVLASVVLPVGVIVYRLLSP